MLYATQTYRQPHPLQTFPHTYDRWTETFIHHTLIHLLRTETLTRVLRVNDVAAPLPLREFKLHCGQISDVGSGASGSGLRKQMKVKKTKERGKVLLGQRSFAP